ncbi:hypothetical protein Ocin01_00027 [Orchesella cincta]|uniref:Uncharacterized protein n=1 Tax=Orchesella cincta TaxID=48709 RepID=A0A1D2NMZ6_ORCCI|nr:hypothetical protein Ocin01_00027 [Orchesella cincta]
MEIYSLLLLTAGLLTIIEMAAPGGKDSHTSILKIALIVLNEKNEHGEFILGCPLSMEDLDNLQSEMMLRIVVRLMRDFIVNLPLSRKIPLSDFNQFKTGEVTYDSGIDRIYHAAAKIFPEENPLHFSTLLLPSRDPKRTKAVIAYIMSFYWMCDDLYARFETSFEDVIEENKEKVKIYNDIEDLKLEISNKIQEKETERDRIPSVQKEIQCIEEKIRKEQIVLTKLNEEVEKHMNIFKGKEGYLKVLKQQLEQLELDRLRLEGQIVANPDEILGENTTIRKQVGSEIAQRDAFGSEINKLTKKCDGYENLINSANNALHDFENVTAMMQDAKSRLVEYMKLGKEVSSESKKLNAELDHLAQQYSVKADELRHKKELCSGRIQKVVNEVKILQTQILQIRGKIKDERSAKQTYSLKLMEVCRAIDELKASISQHIRTRKVDLPKQRFLLEMKTKQELENSLKQLASFSSLAK